MEGVLLSLYKHIRAIREMCGTSGAPETHIRFVWDGFIHGFPEEGSTVLRIKSLAWGSGGGRGKTLVSETGPVRGS